MELKDVKRQSDKKFIDILQNIRVGRWVVPGTQPSKWKLPNQWALDFRWRTDIWLVGVAYNKNVPIVW